jgi:pimeloyl-ACP methyl ester carboxylesterase
MQSGIVNGIGFDEEGSGSAVIFLHGLSWDRRIWQPLIARLSHQFRCVALDLPGHGQSHDLPQTIDYRLEAVALRLHGAIALLKIESPILVGHSLGGIIASFYAAAFPVRGVVNLDQPLRLAPLMAAAKERKDMLRGADFPQFWSALMQSFGLEQLPDGLGEWAQSLSRPRQEIVLNYWDQLLEAEAEAFQDHVDGTLRRIGAPYVAAYGVLPGRDYADWIKARLAHAEVIDLAVPSHFPHLLDPDRFAAIVREIAV